MQWVVFVRNDFSVGNLHIVINRKVTATQGSQRPMYSLLRCLPPQPLGSSLQSSPCLLLGRSHRRSTRRAVSVSYGRRCFGWGGRQFIGISPSGLDGPKLDPFVYVCVPLLILCEAKWFTIIIAMCFSVKPWPSRSNWVVSNFTFMCLRSIEENYQIKHLEGFSSTAKPWYSHQRNAIYWMPDPHVTDQGPHLQPWGYSGYRCCRMGWPLRHFFWEITARVRDSSTRGLVKKRDMYFVRLTHLPLSHSRDQFSGGGKPFTLPLIY